MSINSDIMTVFFITECKYSKSSCYICSMSRLIPILARGVAVLAAVLGIISCRSRVPEVIPNHPHNIRPVNFAKEFNDLNPIQLEVAQAIGVKPVKDREEAQRMNKKLVEISTNPLYKIDSLTHSIPFLTKGADRLLTSIGENFRDSLVSKGLNPYRLIVTSVMRTESDVLRLRKSGNINASDNSTHCYGTTFDIAYYRYDKILPEGRKAKRYTYEDVSPDVLKLVLGEVLRDLRKEGKCYVKHERKQPCFHVTTRLK